MRGKPMPTDHRELLKNIRTFPSLIKYLHDELDWPITSGDFEELTFDYTPEELGIDSKNAAKIQEIKRLRPLSANQPWGIFFVKFEPKRLPVVALRRILSRVVVKKRVSANSAERAAWEMDDLLFVSNYGEGEERRINLAHFTHDKQSNLPTLKVLGWDNLDTPLHLDHVADVLNEKLSWPEDEEDMELWRETWRSAFTLRHREVITTSKALAIKLAELARGIRNRINAVLAIETEDGPVTKLMKAFQEALIHDLDEDGFADMYAQTIAYGLLSARIANPGGDTTDDIATQLPVTNPFLKELMETFLDVGGQRDQAGGSDIDFDELGVSEVVELLDDANMEAVLRDFGDRSPHEDPVIHFYELFLKEYDANQKVKRGVFYTPRSVVSYIVHSVDELLRTSFDLEDGLADTTTWGEMVAHHEGIEIPEGADPGDPFVQILDPATGTGTFLVEVIDIIHKTMMEKWKAEGQGGKEIESHWNDYIPKHLLPRLHGYELLMAPYTIAHLKIGLKLYETGYRFGSEERARVFLTNSLESPSDQQLTLDFLPALAHEAVAVNDVKRNQRFTVVIGNPPYSLMSSNLGAEQRRLIDEYRFVDGVKIKERGALQLEKNLQDDYVKFIRVAQMSCEQSDLSIMGFITNHSYINNPTLRGLRRSLMGTFNSLWVLDLHGNTKRKERCPLPEQDRNVFDIQQGVAILLGTKPPDTLTCEIQWGELWGSRERKYADLLGGSFRGMSNVPASPVSPLYIFAAQDEELRDEFNAGVPLDEIFTLFSTGIATARDRLTVHFTREELRSTVHEFASLQGEEARKRFELRRDTNDWKVALAIRDVRRTDLSEDRERIYQYRPFDRRHTYYTGQPRGFHCNPRWPVMQHLIAGRNVALCGVKAIETGHHFGHAFVTTEVADHHSVSMKEVNYIFPSLVYQVSIAGDEAGQRGLFSHHKEEHRTNLAGEFLSLINQRLGIAVGSDSMAARGPYVNTDDVVAYIYCVLYSPTYRTRYADFLRKEYARIPITCQVALFTSMAHLGDELVALHLMESHKIDDFISTYEGPKNPEVGRVGWSDGIVWLDAEKTKARDGHRATEPGTIGFKGVPEDVWEFHIGGYQVCHKWLKDRKGRTLTEDDLSHYQKIVVAINETIRIMGEIDEVIKEHGGWPDAFSVLDE
jgi:predicted helicase